MLMVVNLELVFVVVLEEGVVVAVDGVFVEVPEEGLSVVVMDDVFSVVEDVFAEESEWMSESCSSVWS